MALSEKRKKHLEEHGYKALGKKPLVRKAVAVKLPEDLYEHVRAQPNMNQWLIAAVLDKAAADLALKSELPSDSLVTYE